eukprot:656608-Pelagomonas_calceolata.AAC.2
MNVQGMQRQSMAFMPWNRCTTQVLMNPKDSQGKEITWRSAAALEGYVKRLNDVAERLAEKTRQLRKWHDVLRDKVNTALTDISSRYL